MASTVSKDRLLGMIEAARTAAREAVEKAQVLIDDSEKVIADCDEIISQMEKDDA